MSHRERIRTPWRRRWQRFRQRALPIASLVGSVVLLAWLWKDQAAVPNGVGEVEAVSVDVIAQIDGTLVPLSRPEWTLYESVQAGELLARFDDRAAEARLATFRAELVRLGKTLETERARVALSEADRQQGHSRDAARLAWDLEQYRLSALERQAIIEADRVELQRRQARVNLLTPLHQEGMVSDIEFSDDKLLLAEVAKRLDENTAILHEIQQQQRAAADRLADFPPLVLADESASWAPVQAAIDVQESRIHEIKLEIENLESRAPITGTITAVHCYPGQRVRAGDPIVTIASQQGRYIVSYVPEERSAQAKIGMGVEVRARSAGSQPRESVVERVGPQFEPIPIHQLRNPQVPEWGLPVRVVLPDGLRVLPGELVDIRFHTGGGDEMFPAVQ